jgi:lipid A 3-O-deacylase
MPAWRFQRRPEKLLFQASKWLNAQVIPASAAIEFIARDVSNGVRDSHAAPLQSTIIGRMITPSPLSGFLRLTTVLIGLAAGLLIGTPSARAQHPADYWEFSVQSGYLKKVRNNSPIDYRIVPSQAVWRSPAVFNLYQSESGVRLTVRNRFAAVVETFARGPEDYYLAFTAAPTFELWSADQKTALFYEIGGGAGLLNSKGVPGGQGQDLAFNWFTQAGLRRQLSSRMALTGGVYFTHHSNLGMTSPNPGIDVLGVNIGLIWRLD